MVGFSFIWHGVGYETGAGAVGRPSIPTRALLCNDAQKSRDLTEVLRGNGSLLIEQRASMDAQ